MRIGLAPRGFTAAFVADLLDLEAGPCDADLCRRTVAWVQARIAGAAQPARLGLELAAALIAGLLVVLERGSYERLPQERRRAVARKLIDARVPVVSDWVRAVRALAFSYYFEARAGLVE